MAAGVECHYHETRCGRPGSEGRKVEGRLSKAHFILWLACLSLAAGGPTLGFHRDGVGSCDGCHVMHQGSVMMIPGSEDTLLVTVSPSDVCLRCHGGGPANVFGSDPLLPPPEKGAGNFAFLFENNLNDAVDGATNPIPGDAAGHSIVAPGRGLGADSRHSLAPGGTFPSSELGCTSCHDPHGTDTFRLLYGLGPVQGGLAVFGYPAPVAEGIGILTIESDSNHSAYHAGVSDWCANCHGNYHDDGLSPFEHPSGESLGPDIANWYNGYEGDDNPTGGSVATAYLAEVPFEDAALPTTTSSTLGPSATSKVMCLTCHRAHASSAPAAGRWDFNVSLLIEDGDVSGSYALPDPYASPTQGTLCAKCHGSGGVAPTSVRDRGGRSISPTRTRGGARRVPR